MSDNEVIFNHIGLCVSNRARSRQFYEGLLGFTFWWEIDPPDDGTDKLLQIDKPIGLHGTYLIRDGLVLELLDYTAREAVVGHERTMDQTGLTHVSMSVKNLGATLRKVAEYGGSIVHETVAEHSAMIRDPDGQLIELLTQDWLNYLPPRPQ